MRKQISASRRRVLKSGLCAIGAVSAGSVLSSPASAETATVTGGGDALQQAIEDASDGDTIVVTDSADYDPITVDVGVTIETDSSPTIVGEGGITSAVGINSDSVTLRGFRITNDGGLIGVKINPDDGNAGIGYDDVTIENNLIENLGPTEFLGVSGIVVGNGSYDNITIANNTIQDLENEVGERSQFNPTVNGVLFDAGNSNRKTVSNSGVNNNTIRRLTSDIAAIGIVTQQKLNDVAINNNDISEIKVDPATDSDDSDDSDGGEPGFVFGQGINITSPSTNDVDINSNRVEEITVQNSTNKDVTVFYGESVKIDGDASGAKFRTNSFFGPVGLNNQNSDNAPEVDARNNYWGSPDGPDTADTNRNADGDDQAEVIGNVRFRPFRRNDPN